MADAPLRILQVLRAPVGGLFRHVADLTESLAERGHQIAVVADSSVSNAATEARLQRLEASAALGVYRLPIPRLLGPGDLTSPVKVRNLAKRLGIHVLHGHGAKGGTTARFARSSGQVALYTPHGGVLHFHPLSLQGRLFSRLERELLKRTDAVIFESAFAKRAFERQIGTPTCPTPVIHNGLRPEEFEPVELAPDARDFVFIGELRDLKGIDLLLEALAPLRRTGGERATLIVAGDGADREKLAARAAQPDLSGRVTFAGVRPAREMLAQGRCLVVPSLAESLPYVVLEGAAAGRPVIATAVGGVAEIYGPTAHSLVPAGDLAALRGALQRVLDNSAAAEVEAAERLAFISGRFSVGTMTDAVEALYRQLIDRR